MGNDEILANFLKAIVPEIFQKYWVNSTVYTFPDVTFKKRKFNVCYLKT